jgi:glycine hydroxymethyltransferase
MGLGLPDGGHLTHGYYVSPFPCRMLDERRWPIVLFWQTAKKKMTASSIYFQSFPYAINPETHLIDYPALASQAKIFKPRLIICGASAYPRDWDYAKLREIADKEGAWLMCDMAHTSGLIAAQELKSPFDYCDVVTTTT